MKCRNYIQRNNKSYCAKMKTSVQKKDIKKQVICKSTFREKWAV